MLQAQSAKPEATANKEKEIQSSCLQLEVENKDQMEEADYLSRVDGAISCRNTNSVCCYSHN